MQRMLGVSLCLLGLLGFWVAFFSAPVPELVWVDPRTAPCPGVAYRTVDGQCQGGVPLVVGPPPGPPRFPPPPPGVTVLKPGHVHESAAMCPPDFREVAGGGGWRFCVDRWLPEPIPNLWSPPIAGIPYEESLRIYMQHQAPLAALSGVVALQLGQTGIHVFTTHPELVPTEVEGLPIVVHTMKDANINQPMMAMNQMNH